MKFYVNWRTATKSIFNNRKRSILTMFGIIIGIAAVIAILSIGRGYERQMIKSLTNGDSEEVKVEVDFSPNDESLYDSNLDFFNTPDLSIAENVDGVKKANYDKKDNSEIYKNIDIKGKSQQKQIVLTKSSDTETLYGRKISAYDDGVKNKVAMIDSITAKDLYGSAKDALNRGVEIDGQLFQIIGIFKGSKLSSMFSMAEQNVILPEKTYGYYFKPEKSTNYIMVTLEKGVTPADVTTKVVKQLEKKGTMRQFGDYQVFDTSLMTDGVSKVLNGITMFISAVAGISLFIAGVGVMNMMYISVSERTKEIGIRRALGATKNSIRMQFLLEGMTLTLSGGIVGYIIGIILAYIIGAIMKISVSVDLFTVSLAVGVSSGIGLIFSVMPASAAAKKDLIDILR